MFSRPWLALVVLMSLVACGGGTKRRGNDADSGTDQTARVWAPASLGFGTFWKLEVEPKLSTPVHFDEQELAYDAVEAHLRTEIGEGRVEADLVLVSEAMGRRLLADGVLEEPFVALFSSEDPEEAAEMFGLILAAPAGRGKGTSALRTAEVARYKNGCLAAVERVALQAPVRASVTSSQMALDVAGAELIEGTVHTAAVGGVKATVMSLATDTAFELFKQLAMAFGKQTAARLLGAAGPATSTTLTAKSLLEMSDASADVTEARSSAEVAAIKTYYEALEAISGARAKLYELRAQLRSCELSGPEASELIDDLGTSVTRYERTARDALADLARTAGDDVPLRDEALDNGVSRFLELWAELRAEAQAKADSTLPEPLTSASEVLEEIIGESDASDWRAFAELLTGLDLENPFTHSNGTLMTTAAGSTDLIAVGSARVAFSAGGLDRFLERFPCGSGPVAFTLCGTHDLMPSTALLTVAVFAAPLPVSNASEHFQYGFVFDADGNPANNYMAPASYPKDLYDRTDRWFEVLHDGTSSMWSLNARLARDGSVTPASTAARAIVHGNSLTMLIPESEFEAMTPGYRVTAFRHSGDYGINPPHTFNGDVYPAVGDPLAMPSPALFSAR